MKILIRLLLRSSLIRIYTVCHSFYIFWRHYFIVKLNCFILRTTTVAGLGVPIFRVFTVSHVSKVGVHSCFSSINVQRVTINSLELCLKSIFVTRRRRRGTIEMTLVHPCVHHSVCPVLSLQLLIYLSSD